MSQDFNKKITICVRKDLPGWQVLNTVAHISAYFGNLLREDFSTGHNFTTKDGLSLPRNTQYGIVVLSAHEKDLKKVLSKAREEGMAWMGFCREMIELIDDEQIQAASAAKGFDEIEFLGIGLFGEKAALEPLTKHLQLWK